MKKRFIILVDFSEYTSNLIRYACDWSKQANADLVLVHETIVIAPSLVDIAIKEKITQQASNAAFQKMKALTDEFIPASIEVSFVISENHIQTTLNNLLAEPFENFIFTGLSGTGLLKQLLIGSMALQIIENVNDIVIAMPKDLYTFSHEKIFVAVTEQHPLNILELNKILNIMDKAETCITFFYLAKPNEKTEGIEKLLTDLANLFADRYQTKTAIYKGRKRIEDIKKVINNKEEELLIVQKGSRLLTDQFFRKFLINELVYEGQTPLIVLP
ncbi:universal stress protein [Kaistella antarctica]|uniref:UspA domain-containing protein n=1 Tax=Kaistella antarctica TaxID=266748 RepID=A0A448NQU1_9FLAO|nr:universal stress protein [Kaistella antarctica]KEY19019.1 hypothetical protein HY04_11265 [Kaistella antarctica]SEW12617.1 hypothetical protein SAMN05421765_2484 [Kaistella antarctica]VEH99060.1 Uncharacterised protein [Kaistella antarctica]